MTLLMTNCRFLVLLGAFFAGVPYAIAAANVQVTAPNGGECLVAGGTYTVVWQGETPSYYALYEGNDPLYQPAPGTWLTDNIAGNAYNWSVPTSTTNGSVVWVEAYDQNHTRFAIDSSDSRFTIASNCGGATGDTEPPTVPENFTANPVAINQINLSWSPATDVVSAVTYRLYKNNTPFTMLSGTSFADASLAPGNSAAYFAVAVDEAGNQSAPSAMVIAVTPTSGGFGTGSPNSGGSTPNVTGDTTPPSAPAGLTASVVTGKLVQFSWQASTDDTGVSGYVIYKNGSELTRVSGLQYDDTNVNGNASYNYTVQAYDGADNRSPQSTVLSVATPGVTIMGTLPPSAVVSPASPAQIETPPSPPSKQETHIQRTLFTKLLKRGFRGADVVVLQDILKEKGFLSTSIASTGFFGDLTLRALKEFQKSRGIEAVGFTGPKTRAALNAE